MQSTIVLVNDQKYILGFIVPVSEGLSFSPILPEYAQGVATIIAKAVEQFHSVADVLTNDGVWHLTYGDKQFVGVSDLGILAENLREQDLLAYVVPEALTHALILVNAMEHEEARARALSEFLYLSDEEAEKVAKNLQTILNRNEEL
jgi:hypothetical protein